MTPHVLDQLPLWVGGDLDAPEMAQVEAHLALCRPCREAADQVQASQAWLREAAASPFGAADRERLRRRVLDQIHAEAPAPPLRPAVRPALLAACAASLLLATLVWRREPSPTPPQAVEASRASLATAQEAAASPARPEPLRTPLARARPQSSGEATPPAEGPARIEFQTADPTVRIIWLAQARPLPEALSPIQEAP